MDKSIKISTESVSQISGILENQVTMVDRVKTDIFAIAKRSKINKEYADTVLDELKSGPSKLGGRNRQYM